MRVVIAFVPSAFATLVACCGGGCHSANADLPRYEYAADIRRDAKVLLLTTTRPADTDLFTADAAGGGRNK